MLTENVNDGKEFELAIVSVLSGSNVVAGNLFILKFIETEQSWISSMMICTNNDNDYIRYFAANILYTKVRKNWSQLSEDKREHLYRFLSEIIYNAGSSTAPSHPGFKLFLNRITLTLCCVCSRASCGIKQFVQLAFTLIDVTNPTSVLSSLGLDMLTVAPSEVEALDVSRALRLELEDQLLTALPQILLLVDSLSSTSQSTALILTVTRLLSSWLSQGITLSALFEEHQSACKMIWVGLQSGDRDATIQTCALLKDIIAISEFPRSAARDRAVLEIMRMMTSSISFLAPFFSTEGSDDVTHEICSCMVSIITCEINLVSAAASCNVDLFSILLSCSAQRPRKVATLTFDAWLSLQDVSVASRHPFLQQEIFYKLLETLLSQCQYPEHFLDWDQETVDDEDDFISFRDHKQGIQDVIFVCFYGLQETFFQCLVGRLKSNDSWFTLEVLLFVLHTVMDSAKEYVIACCDTNTITVQLLYEVIKRAISLDIQSTHPCLLESASKFLGSTTFLLTWTSKGGTNPCPDYFFPSLEFLFRVFAVSGRGDPVSDSIGKSAANSIYKLCIKGSHIFSLSPNERFTAIDMPSVSDKIVGLVNYTAQILCSRCDARSAQTSDTSSLLLVWEAVTRTITISKLDVDLARNLIGVLGRPILVGLQCEIDSPTPTGSKAELLLDVATQMIKFSDQSHVDQRQLIGDFLNVLWPLLKVLPDHQLLRVLTGVTSKLFSLFRSSILSARDIILPEIVGIVTVVLAYLVSSLSVTGHDHSSCFAKQSSNVSALECASSAVEALISRSSQEGDQLLSHLLLQITEVVFLALQSDFQQHVSGSSVGSTVSGKITDPETIEKYFSYVYLHFMLCPQIISQESYCLQKIVCSSWMALSMYKERGPVRCVCQVVQSLFFPVSQKLIPYHETFIQISYERGGEIINEIIQSLCGETQSSLYPNLIDTLLYVINGCEEKYPEKSRAWVFAALSDESVAGLRLLSPTDKQLAFTAMFRLASTDKRRFKALLQDFCKICSSEATADCLLTYEE